MQNYKNSKNSLYAELLPRGRLLDSFFPFATSQGNSVLCQCNKLYINRYSPTILLFNIISTMKGFSRPDAISFFYVVKIRTIGKKNQYLSAY